MRSPTESPDRGPVLGAPIREAKPAPAPVPVAPGVVRNADGTLETRAAPPPPPPAAPTPAPDWSKVYGNLGQPVGHITDGED